MEKALHLISDGTCHCLTAIANSVISYFDNADLKQYYWPLIQTEEDLRNCCEKIIAKPGMVLYTLRDSKIIQQLQDCCYDLNIPAIAPIDQVIGGFHDYFGLTRSAEQHNRLNEKYFSRMEAINFTLNHDDGRSIETIDKADIIIVGPSRSSKTPTAMYLSYQGYKIANIPFIFDLALPEQLTALSNKLVIGLIVTPARLSALRYSRLSEINGAGNTNYFDINHVTQECIMAKRIFLERNWPIFDVTYKSIEEISAEILKTYYLFQMDLVNEQ
jgi:regulator of PEP synthase PpsR (kinase-PPPase family)